MTATAKTKLALSIQPGDVLATTTGTVVATEYAWTPTDTDFVIIEWSGGFQRLPKNAMVEVA